MRCNKIAINTRLLRKNEMDGIGWFTYNTLKYIVPANPQIEFHFLFDSGIDDEFIFSSNIKPVNLFPPAKHAILNMMWFEWSTKNYLNKNKPDLFFSPDGILCLGWNGKQHGVIHDVNFLHIPEDLKYSNRKYYNHFFPKYASKAERLATVSEYSKNDISKSFNVSPDKIDVVYCGINDFYKPVSAETKRQIKEKYTGGCEYFIFIGTLHPRKNILRMMEAFELFKRETNASLKFIIAGKEMFRTSEMHEYKAAMQFGEDIIFTGRLNDEQLQQSLATAFALIFVPYFEGFGIPPLEAMQCNVPVISSNVTSLPEVVGDAALFVNPYNVEEIKDAMLQIYANEELRNNLIVKGLRQKEKFSWERTASLLWTSIEKCF